uniref:Transmembrane protein 135 N-terminal domain-containing protein n=1 Tax=Globisporangium ultimum (strain ATCC 200006 / CBS 805.95 / DAOM BR144) TaxID=431595 RepID=K3W753_GLOUD
MERVYSAFFTVDRSKKETPPLTAEALEKHNERTQGSSHAKKARSTEDDARPSLDANGPLAHRPYGHDATTREQRRGKPNNRRRIQDDEDESEYADARRRDLTQLTFNYAYVKRDVKAAFKAALRVFLYAYGAKAFTALLLASRKFSSLEYGYVDAVRLLLRVDTIRFGAFFGSLVGVFRLTEIAARLARAKKDQTNLAIAGAVSGLTLLVDSKARRNTISLYIFVRFLDVVGRHLTATGVLPDWKYSPEFLFAASNSAIMYAFIFEPMLLPKSYYNWILNIGAVTDHGLAYTLRERLEKVVDANGSPIPFRVCQPHYHMESCTTHGVKEWIGGLGRAAQVYLPVHILPALIFRFSQIKAAPISSAARVSYAALCSCLFLTSYQTVVKLVMCAIRNTFHRDFSIGGWIAGFSTGAALFLENRKRRAELMLYCLSRALDIVWRLLKRRGLVRYVQHSEVALFSLSMAGIMSSPPEHFKPTYLRILRFVFGRDII